MNRKECLVLLHAVKSSKKKSVFPALSRSSSAVPLVLNTENHQFVELNGKEHWCCIQNKWPLHSGSLYARIFVGLRTNTVWISMHSPCKSVRELFARNTSTQRTSDASPSRNLRQVKCSHCELISTSSMKWCRNFVDANQSECNFDIMFLSTFAIFASKKIISTQRNDAWIKVECSWLRALEIIERVRAIAIEVTRE